LGKRRVCAVYGDISRTIREPFKRQARQLASARLRKSFNYVVVSPALPLTTVLADDHGHWLPIKPGTDSALAMAMIRWIIDNERYVAAYLKLTSREAMTRAGEKAGAMPPGWLLPMKTIR
jgi:tetrathionate reductase subunit A